MIFEKDIAIESQKSEVKICIKRERITSAGPARRMSFATMAAVICQMASHASTIAKVLRDNR